MKIDQLTYFVEAAKHQHLGRAARRLAISQSAISHSIASLEKELGRELFRKQGRQLSLTSHGRLLAERAGKILEELERLAGDIVSDRTEMQRHYRIGATSGLAAFAVPPAWNRLIAHHPRLTVEVTSARSADVLAKVASGELDFGVCLDPQTHPNVTGRKLAETASHVVVRRGHPLLRARPEALTGALARYPYVGALELEGISPCRNHPVFRRFEKPPLPSFVYDSYEVAAREVALSDGWTLFPDWLFAHLGRGLCRVGLAGTVTFEVHAVWPQARALSPVGERLVGYLEAELNGEPLPEPSAPTSAHGKKAPPVRRGFSL